MAGSQTGFRWKHDSLSSNLKILPAQVERAVIAAVEYGATIGEARARQDAPWTDRSADARNTLNTRTQHRTGEHRIILAHGMPYGIFLETRWAGRYRVIVPTINWTGDQVMKLLNGLLSRPIGG